MPYTHTQPAPGCEAGSVSDFKRGDKATHLLWDLKFHGTVEFVSGMGLVVFQVDGKTSPESRRGFTRRSDGVFKAVGQACTTPGNYLVKGWV